MSFRYSGVTCSVQTGTRLLLTLRLDSLHGNFRKKNHDFENADVHRQMLLKFKLNVVIQFHEAGDPNVDSKLLHLYNGHSLKGAPICGTSASRVPDSM